jgi:LacI family transcriptional regulator
MRLQDWRIGYLSREGIPFVSFGRSRMDDKAPHIEVDGRAGIRELVGHLVEQGHRHIAFIAAPKDLTLAPDRLDGYKDGLSDAGIAFDSELVIEGSLTRSAGYEAAKELLKRVPPPTAIVGANDLSALGAMRAAQERGMAIGQELAIAGFDGIEASEHSHPALTTVSQPVYEIGRRVCSMLISIIEGEEYSDSETLIKPTLVIRQSTLNGKE